jgi:hypothetical protein
MILHFFFMKNAVNGGFRGKINPFVGENGHNLTGRHTGKAFFIYRVQNRLAFLGAELVGRVGMIRIGSAIFAGTVFSVEGLPAVIRPLSNSKLSACISEPGARRNRLVNQHDSFRAI